MKQENKKGLKFWLQILKANVKLFFKNPAQYIKNYIKEFKELDTKGKVKKVLLTFLGFVAIYYIVGYAVGLLLGLAFIGGWAGNCNYELLRHQFIERHGREPDNEYEVYHDF